MKKLLAISTCLFLLLAFSGVTLAGDWHRPQTKKISDQQVTLASGTTATLTCPGGANMAWIFAQGDAIRFKAGDTDPTGATGALLYAGDAKKLFGKEEIGDFVAILKEGGSGATIYVIYYRE